MTDERAPHFLRRTLLAGLLTLLPLVITYALVAFLFGMFTGVGGPLGLDGHPWLGPLVPLVNLTLTVAVIFVLGLFATNVLGRRLLAAFERQLMRLPVVRSIRHGLRVGLCGQAPSDARRAPGCESGSQRPATGGDDASAVV